MDNQKLLILKNIIPDVLDKIPQPGLLLVVGSNKENKNVMTIGWIQFGWIWQELVVSIMVRPSRYSYKLLEKYDNFTINCMPDKYDNAISFCGTKSGSFCDKFKEAGLDVISSEKIDTPSLKNAEIVMECSIQYKHNIDPKQLSDILIARYYSGGDFHQLITASIVNLKIKDERNE